MRCSPELWTRSPPWERSSSSWGKPSPRGHWWWPPPLDNDWSLIPTHLHGQHLNFKPKLVCFINVKLILVMWLLSAIQTLPISLVQWSAKNLQIFKERNLNLQCTVVNWVPSWFLVLKKFTYTEYRVIFANCFLFTLQYLQTYLPCIDLPRNRYVKERYFETFKFAES